MPPSNPATRFCAIDRLAGHPAQSQLSRDLRRLYSQVQTRPVLAPIDVNDPKPSFRKAGFAQPADKFFQVFPVLVWRHIGHRTKGEGRSNLPELLNLCLSLLGPS